MDFIHLLQQIWGFNSSKEDITKHTTIKILKNGYWMTRHFFGNHKITVESAVVAPTLVKDGKYIETVNFYSEERFADG